MARLTTVSVSLKDHSGQTGSLSYSFERGWLAALADFLNWPETKADALQAFAETYSNALVTKSGVSNAKSYDLPNGFIGGGEIEKGWDTCDQKGVLTFMDTDTGANHQITIPAPKGSMFQTVAGQGYRVIPATGAAIATALSTIYGMTLVFKEGWLIGKK